MFDPSNALLKMALCWSWLSSLILSVPEIYPVFIRIWFCLLGSYLSNALVRSWMKLEDYNIFLLSSYAIMCDYMIVWELSIYGFPLSINCSSVDHRCSRNKFSNKFQYKWLLIIFRIYMLQCTEVVKNS